MSLTLTSNSILALTSVSCLVLISDIWSFSSSNFLSNLSLYQPCQTLLTQYLFLQTLCPLLYILGSPGAHSAQYHFQSLLQFTPLSMGRAQIERKASYGESIANLDFEVWSACTIQIFCLRFSINKHFIKNKFSMEKITKC